MFCCDLSQRNHQGKLSFSVLVDQVISPECLLSKSCCAALCQHAFPLDWRQYAQTQSAGTSLHRHLLSAPSVCKKRCLSPCIPPEAVDLDGAGKHRTSRANQRPSRPSTAASYQTSLPRDPQANLIFNVKMLSAAAMLLAGADLEWQLRWQCGSH